jgi:hypothetical protein
MDTENLLNEAIDLQERGGGTLAGARDCSTGMAVPRGGGVDRCGRAQPRSRRGAVGPRSRLHPHLDARHEGS